MVRLGTSVSTIKPKFKIGDLIELIRPTLFDSDEPLFKKVENIDLIYERYELSFEIERAIAKVYISDRIEVVDKFYQLKTDLVAGYTTDRCDCGALKTFNTMQQQYHSFWCKSQK